MIVVSNDGVEVLLIVDTGKVITLTVKEANALLHDMKVRDAIIHTIHKLENKNETVVS